MGQYLKANYFVSGLGTVVRGIIPFLFDLLSGTGLALSNRVNGFKVRWVRQHGDMNWVISPKVEVHRGGQMREYVADGGRVLWELAEAAHFAVHELKRTKPRLSEVGFNPSNSRSRGKTRSSTMFHHFKSVWSLRE